MLAEPTTAPTNPPKIFCRLIDQLMTPADAKRSNGVTHTQEDTTAGTGTAIIVNVAAE